MGSSYLVAGMTYEETAEAFASPTVLFWAWIFILIGMQVKLGYEEVVCVNGSVQTCSGFDLTDLIFGVAAVWFSAKYWKARSVYYADTCWVTLAGGSASLGGVLLVLDSFRGLDCLCR